MEIDAITEYKGVGKLGWLCQKHKLQHPNHVKVSLLGLLTDYFTVAICGRIREKKFVESHERLLKSCIFSIAAVALFRYV